MCLNQKFEVESEVKIILKFGVYILNLIYRLYKIFPIKNRVLFISRQSDTISIDCSMLSEVIRKKDEKDVYKRQMQDNGILHLRKKNNSALILNEIGQIQYNSI